MTVRRAMRRLALPLGALFLVAPALPAQAATANGASLGTTTVQHYRAWTVQDDRIGTTIVWSGQSEWTGNARPEFAVNGQAIGVPLTTSGGQSLQLSLPGVHGIAGSQLSVVLAGHRLDSAGRPAAHAHSATPTLGPQPTPPPATAPFPTQPSTLVQPDPGVAGNYPTRAFRYTMPSIQVPGMAVPIEVVGKVVVPVGAPGLRPVIVFLHGRHSTCYGGDQTTIDWPCASGFSPIPSLDGYAYAQQLLASRGYVTISIAANGINGQDGDAADSGMQARSLLVRHHLDLLASWNKAAGAGLTGLLQGRLDMSHVMLVGHSRGGEGVVRAAIDSTATDPYRIVGEVLIAPTDFGRQVAPGMPTTVLLPYCDGDVSDLQGQQYIDQSRGLITGDHALRTALLVMGANHNFFNSEWTPGIAAAPASDDWGDTTDTTCAPKAAGRLSAAEQRAVGATYISAAADTYLRDGSTAVKLIDGSATRTASLGKAVVLAEALGGRRTDVLADPRHATLTNSRSATSLVCPGFTTDGSTPCLPTASGSPHWLQGDIPSGYALAVGWLQAGGTVQASFLSPIAVKSASFVDLRVLADPLVVDSAYRVSFTDASGRTWVNPTIFHAQPLPGSSWTSKVWARSVRVPLAWGKTRVTSVRSISIVGVSKSGHIFVLDAFATSHGTMPSSVTSWSVPRFDVTTTTATLPGDDAMHPVDVTVNVTGAVTQPAHLWVSVQGSSGPINVDNPPATLPNGLTDVTVDPGTTSLTFTVSAFGSSLFSTTGDPVSIRAYAAQDAVVSSYVGGATVRSNVPAPTLSVDQANVTVTQGQPMVWIIRLSAPTRYGWSDMISAVAPTSGAELLTSDLLPQWSQTHVGMPTLPSGAAAPLSQSGLAISTSVDMTATTAVIEIPTSRVASTNGDRIVALDIASDGVILQAPLHLTGLVHAPAP